MARERDVLDQLLVCLRDEDGCDDVQSNGLLASISGLELHRAITAREVALEMGMSGEPTLQDIVDWAPGEWAPVLAGHRRALQEAVASLQLLLRHRPTSEGNVIILPVPGRPVQRSLLDFLS